MSIRIGDHVRHRVSKREATVVDVSVSTCNVRMQYAPGSYAPWVGMENVELVKAAQPECSMKKKPEPLETPRSKILSDADEAIHGERNTHYGSPMENFERIATYWSAYLGREITSPDVAHMMILLKIARAMNMPTRDTYLDIAGYAACGYETTGAGL